VAKPESRYRVGDRDDDAKAGRAQYMRSYRDRARKHKLDDDTLRAAILSAVQRGTSVADAAAEHGLTSMSVWGYARHDEAFAAALDDATAAHAICTAATQGAYGYRLGCRCPDCRAGHHEENRRYRT
jgi:hypothetical protein